MDAFYKGSTVSLGAEGEWIDAVVFTVGSKYWKADGTQTSLPEGSTLWGYDAKTKMACTHADHPIDVSIASKVRFNTGFGTSYVTGVSGMPVAVFLDDDGTVKGTIASQTVTLPVVFSVPEGATKMHCNLISYSYIKLLVDGVEQTPENNGYLMKKVLDDVESNYRNFSRRTLSAHEKAFITFTIDDTRNDMDAICDEFLSRHIPLCPATIAANVPGIKSTGVTGYEKLCEIVEDGGEILCHHAHIMTASNWDADAYEHFVTQKRLLEKFGWEINGIILAGGTGADTIDKTEAEKWSAKYYAYSDNYGTAEPYKCERIGMWFWDIDSGAGGKEDEKLQRFKDLIDDAVTNKKRISFYFHDLNECPLARLRASLDYALSKQTAGVLEIGTYKQYYNKYYYGGTL